MIKNVIYILKSIKKDEFHIDTEDMAISIFYVQLYIKMFAM